jgi:hypothetical protein
MNAVTASKQDRAAAMFANLGKLRCCILAPSGGFNIAEDHESGSMLKLQKMFRSETLGMGGEK